MQKKSTFDFLSPIVHFMQSGLFSALLLFSSAILSLILANTPANSSMHELLDQRIGFTFETFSLYKPLLLWINDGLMSIFFFVVGLELKREIVAGELSNPKNVIMPIVGAIGGMIIPALIFLFRVHYLGTYYFLIGYTLAIIHPLYQIVKNSIFSCRTIDSITKLI